MRRRSANETRTKNDGGWRRSSRQPQRKRAREGLANHDERRRRHRGEDVVNELVVGEIPVWRQPHGTHRMESRGCSLESREQTARAIQTGQQQHVHVMGKQLRSQR